MPEQKAVAKKQDPIMDLLSKYKPMIQDVLPKHLTPEKMMRLSHIVISRNPKLRECTALSLLNGVIETSILGLELGRTAHLIPFKSEAVLIIDYKGMIELAHRSDKIVSTPLKAVYENDFFDYTEGTERYIKHKPATNDRGKLVAAYAIVNFKDGGFDFEVCLPEDAAIAKAHSPAKNKQDSPWNKKDEEYTMWCKTAMRKLAKRIPQSPELQRAAYLEELVEAGLKQNLSHVTDSIEADFTPVEDQEADPEKVKEDLDKKLGELKDKGQTKTTVKCPNMNNMFVNVEKCETCNDREGCPSW